MLIYANGSWVEAQKAVVPFNDQGFLYGDSLFETIRVNHGRAFRLEKRGSVYIAGLVLALIATIPIINLLLPLFGTSMMLHVFERLRPPDSGINITLTNT